MTSIIQHPTSAGPLTAEGDDDRLHPLWCDPSPTCQHDDEPGYRQHFGHRTTFFADESDDVEISMKLEHHEDLDKEKINHSTTDVVLTLRNTALASRAEVRLSRNDLGTLITLLTKYQALYGHGHELWMEESILTADA